MKDVLFIVVVLLILADFFLYYKIASLSSQLSKMREQNAETTIELTRIILRSME